jgi:hypothetical protein
MRPIVVRSLTPRSLVGIDVEIKKVGFSAARVDDPLARADTSRDEMSLPGARGSEPDSAPSDDGRGQGGLRKIHTQTFA